MYAAHPTMGSQGIRRELNPYLLVHSQACSDRYTTDTMSKQPDQDLNPELCVESQHDFRFTIEPKRKAWDLNPHGGEAARFSKPARRAVSGYLP